MGKFCKPAMALSPGFAVVNKCREKIQVYQSSLGFQADEL